jgi:predicted transcriptional regulator
MKTKIKKPIKVKQKTGSKSKDWVFIENKDLIIELYRNGFSIERIAGRIGISPATFYNYQKKNLEFLDNLKNSVIDRDSEVVDSLYKSTKGYEVTEEHTEFTEDENGKVKIKTIKRTKKYIKPDTMAQIYWLNNRMSEVFRTRQEVSHTILNKDEAKKAITEMFEK